MTPHPNRVDFLRRLSERVDNLVSGFKGSVFRFVTPKYASVGDMFAGNGSLHASGRWLTKSQKLAAYTSLLPETALAEALAANRYYGFPDENAAPLVFVTASAKLQRVIDLREGRVRQRLKIAERAILDSDWRRDNREGSEALTQAWGWAFHEAGAEGLLCPSAAGNGEDNLIVFPENLLKSSHLKVLSEVQWPRS